MREFNCGVLWMYVFTFAAIAYFLTGCGSIRGIELCKLDISNGVGHCAEGSKTYDKPLSFLDGYIALSEANARKIGDKLEACEREEK